MESIFPIQFYRVIPYGNLCLSTQFNNKYPRHTVEMKKNLMDFVTFVTRCPPSFKSCVLTTHSSKD